MEALLCIADERGRNQPFQGREQLGDVGDGILGLPVVIEKLGLGHVGVGVDTLPERPAAQVAMGEGLWRYGGAVRGRKDGRMGLGGHTVVELGSHKFLVVGLPSSGIRTKRSRPFSQPSDGPGWHSQSARESG